MSIFDEAARLERENVPFALAHIIESHGSTPRHSGQMIVQSDGKIIGTIGGGMIERMVIAEAVEAIGERKARVVQGRMARSGEDAVGSDCGGTMRVFIDVHGLRPRLILLGAGHVNRAVAKAAAPLGFAIFVADTLSQQNKNQLTSLGIYYLELKNNPQSLKDFKNILVALDIPTN